ncbi:lipid A-modifier LpxR family protein [Falsihalocynthiibacter arcticus]|uniref:lipid A-modifier LpxR family protein n=1 Tax=Falsihalocynthiibacter arcticus TaxID=1579316 RepID=UPI0014703D01|nr:lipid A-modifier LpxR family protein [Falsihalocynthiibacter arcticus]
MSFLVGGDIAFVESSQYLPSQDGITLNQNRVRARAGVQWQGESHPVFYGLTYLGKEFDEQSEGQVVGSVALRRRF